jgi:alkyl hydroperoxide reductase subunit AhpC
MPGLSALMPRFEAVGTQVLGVSVDSIPCHEAWARGLGGVAFPLLADFHPKGEVGRAYGVFDELEGITQRGTLLVGRDGTVLWSEVFECGFRIPASLFRVAQAFAG